MKNIAIIISKLEGGGAERVASNLSKSLSDNHNVILIVFDGTKITYPYEGKLIDLELPPRKSIVGKVINVFKRSYKVKKLKKDYGIDCSISLMDGPNLVNVISKYKDVIITSVRIHLSSSENTNIFRQILVKVISFFSDSVVALSREVKQDLVDNFQVSDEKIRVIYNSVDEILTDQGQHDYFSSIETKILNKTYISTMGRLTTQKGHWHLIRVFKSLEHLFNDLHLVILGKGPLQIKLQKLIDDFNLSDRVHLLGYVENPHFIIENSEIFVFPSLYEGLGNALLEALSCGVPVISTDCKAGPRELLEGPEGTIKNSLGFEVAEYGVLTPKLNGGNFSVEDSLTEEEEALKGAIIYVLENEDLKSELRDKSLLRAKDFYPQKISRQWDLLVNELLEKRSKKL